GCSKHTFAICTISHSLHTMIYDGDNLNLPKKH
ncbi:unnamed protein product, partial [marine sediment metagenome]